jgi:4-diphosphocytidyl-2-C-methyl-D-erythritol kinase
VGSKLSISGKSYAKVNLYLYVTGKRADGYHELDTLFYGIDLYDTITLTESAKTTLRTNLPYIPTDQRNIIMKVDAILRAEYGLTLNYTIDLHKNIPVGAGLGGGSGNAACYLQLVNKIADLGLSIDDMHSILARVGSDTAFFLYLPAAIGRGRGEILTPIKEIEKVYMILINPKIFISTKEIFINKKLKLTTLSDIPTIKDSYPFNDLVQSMHNDLQPVAESLHPEISDICKSLELAGAERAMMSGSGSTVFGVFRDEDSRDKAFERLDYPDYLVVKTAGLL